MTCTETNQELGPYKWPVLRQTKNQGHTSDLYKDKSRTRPIPMTCTETNQEPGPYQWPVLRQIKNQAHTNDLY